MNKFDRGDSIAEGIGVMFVLLIIAALVFSAFFVRFKPSDDVVSGIVYNTKNNTLIGGKTTFSVRASVDTYTNDSNESDFCLPPNSPYKDLVNKAAEDKTIKVIVHENKYFAIQAPWVCNANVTVTEESNASN